MIIIQNFTILLSLKAKFDKRPFLNVEKSFSEPLRGQRRPRLLSFPFKTYGWLYLGSPIEAAPISETRYTTFYQHGFIRTNPCRVRRGEERERRRKRGRGREMRFVASEKISFTSTDYSENFD